MFYIDRYANPPAIYVNPTDSTSRSDPVLIGRRALLQEAMDGNPLALSILRNSFRLSLWKRNGKTIIKTNGTSRNGHTTKATTACKTRSNQRAR